MHERQPDHWLYRLNADEWLRAAENELQSARAAFLAGSQRAAVALSRRAAGMALNALLWHKPDPTYGRSYMDHIKALQEDDAAPPTIRSAAAALQTMPTVAEVIVLGKARADQAAPAAQILDYARGLLP